MITVSSSDVILVRNEILLPIYPSPYTHLAIAEDRISDDTGFT